MNKLLIALLAAEGAPFRVRGIGTLALIAGFIYLAITGYISAEVYTVLTTGFGAAYMGSRISRDASAEVAASKPPPAIDA